MKHIFLIIIILTSAISSFAKSNNLDPRLSGTYDNFFATNDRFRLHLTDNSILFTDTKRDIDYKYDTRTKVMSFPDKYKEDFLEEKTNILPTLIKDLTVTNLITTKHQAYGVLNLNLKLTNILTTVDLNIAANIRADFTTCKSETFDPMTGMESIRGNTCIKTKLKNISITKFNSGLDRNFDRASLVLLDTILKLMGDVLGLFLNHEIHKGE